MEIPTKEEMRKALEQKQGQELTERFARGVVAICGLGGLGSNIAVTLARAGVGRLILIDFDRVEVSNLNRQQYKAEQIGMYKTDALCANLLEITPYIDLTDHTCRIGPDNCTRLLEDADIICEAFDSAKDKAMLTNHVLETMPDKYYIAASGMAGMGPAGDIQTKKISDRFFLCGDGVSDVDSGIGLVPSRVLLCAAGQAHTVLRILAGIA